MLRKSLFWGLTVVLVAALVSLIVQGRRLEKQQAGGKVMEVIQESRPSPTRILAPRDLEIVQQKMLLEKASDGKSQHQTARHEMEILNKGTVAYGRVQLNFEYLDRSGKLLATGNHVVEEAILPGTALRLADIIVEGLPVAIADCRTAIVYAELGPASKTER